MTQEVWLTHLMCQIRWKKNAGFKRSRRKMTQTHKYLVNTCQILMRGLWYSKRSWYKKVCTTRRGENA